MSFPIEFLISVVWRKDGWYNGEFTSLFADIQQKSFVAIAPIDAALQYLAEPQSYSVRPLALTSYLNSPPPSFLGIPLSFLINDKVYRLLIFIYQSIFCLSRLQYIVPFYRFERLNNSTYLRVFKLLNNCSECC